MDKLEKTLTIIDGGMGQELQSRSGKTGGLWSAQALLDAPELVEQVHQEYVAAGAQVIITNTYSTIPSYLAKGNLADRAPQLAELAGKIARRVADDAPHPVQVAGALPPLDESYRWDLVPAWEDAEPIYTQLAQVLLPYVDLFICETMSCVQESVNAVSAARKVAGAKPVWVAWTLAETPGGGLRSGESIAAAVEALDDFAVDAYLFNCCTPAAITAALPQLRQLTEKPIGAYPNLLHIPSGWTLDNDVPTGRAELSTSEFVEYAKHWQSLGVDMVGGCCGIGPRHIAALAQAS